MDDRTLARWRMRTLRLAGAPYPTPTDAIRGLLAVQAEQHAHAKWAVATRTSDANDVAMDRLFDAGAYLRTHVLRPTWHYLHPDDIRWLVELTSPRVRRSMRTQDRQLGIDDGVQQAANEVIADALAGGTHLTREQVGRRLADAGIEATGQRLGHLMLHAELSALVCSGPMDETHHSYALLDERAPDARRLDRDEALAELALRYFTGHGPATERDLAYWASLTLTDVRAGLAAVADHLDHLDHEGRTYWFAPPPPQAPTADPVAHLLLVLDEAHNGYQDSRGVIDVEGVVPPGRPSALGMVLLDGQMVGRYQRHVKAGSVEFSLTLFTALTRADRDAVEAAADRQGRFLGLDASVTTG